MRTWILQFPANAGLQPFDRLAIQYIDRLDSYQRG
jgi:hypothetical protein